MISGKIGINLAASWYQPKKLTEPNVDKAVNRAMQFELGWFAEPILLTGDYPIVMKDQIAMKSQAQGVDNRLPQFTVQEKSDIKGIKYIFYIIKGPQREILVFITSETCKESSRLVTTFSAPIHK